MITIPSLVGNNEEVMEETVHILKGLDGFDNIMMCGAINKSWVGVHHLDMSSTTLKGITCQECRSAYGMQVLGEL
jgi:hypothetical protein